MKFLIFILLLFVNASAFDEERWNKIIFFSDNKPKVVSSKFYLSHEKKLTAKKELDATIKLLKSKKYGYTTACNYPLRYTFIKSQNIDIPTYNLKSCSELQKFTQNFKNSELYLAFSSEYISVPSSAFGHVMLLFKDKTKPIEIANVIHFAATTQKKDGFFKYNYKGLTGGYEGHYALSYLFKKLYEYNTKEQRNIYLYRLNFSDKQIKNIVLALYELRKATFKYYFFDKNCASYATELLNISSNKVLKKRYFYLPIDTLQQYKKDINSKIIFLSLIYKINYLYDHLSYRDKNKFDEIIRDNKIVNDTLSNDLKLILIDYYQFQFRKFHISYKNYNSIMKLHYKDKKIEYNDITPLSKKASVVALEYGKNSNRNSIVLSYKPLYSDLNDFDYNPLQATEFSVLDTEINIKKNALSLNKLTFLSLKSYAKRTVFYHPISWQLYSALDKENVDKKIKFTNQIGLGLTNEYFDKTEITILGNLRINNITPYLAPEIYLSQYIGNKIHIEGDFYENLTLDKNYYNTSISLSLKQKDFIYSLKGINSTNKKYLGIKIKYYF